MGSMGIAADDNYRGFARWSHSIFIWGYGPTLRPTRSYRLGAQTFEDLEGRNEGSHPVSFQAR